MFQFPITDNGNSTHEITLFGKVFTFKYNYNTRNERLYLSIFDGSTLVISGLRLVEFGFPIQPYVIESFPNIQLFVAWLGATNTQPTLGNFGIDKEFSLIAIEPSDLI